jgi:hypothetical protein
MTSRIFCLLTLWSPLLPAGFLTGWTWYLHLIDPAPDDMGGAKAFGMGILVGIVCAYGFYALGTTAWCIYKQKTAKEIITHLFFAPLVVTAILGLGFLVLFGVIIIAQGKVSVFNAIPVALVMTLFAVIPVVCIVYGSYVFMLITSRVFTSLGIIKDLSPRPRDFTQLAGDTHER